jgi:hypothetical protein
MLLRVTDLWIELDKKVLNLNQIIFVQSSKSRFSIKQCFLFIIYMKIMNLNI